MKLITSHSKAADMIRCSVSSSVSVFFFQAEDGIRDTSVTGVQTCALPIYGRLRGREQPRGVGIRMFCRRGDRFHLVDGFGQSGECSIGDRPTHRHLWSLFPKIGRASCRERVENVGVELVGIDNAMYDFLT